MYSYTICILVSKRAGPYDPGRKRTLVLSRLLGEVRGQTCLRTKAGRLFGYLAQFLQVGRDMVREDPGPGDQDVRPRLRDDRGGVDLDSPIHLEFRLQSFLVEVRPRLADLRDDIGAERLAREARLDGHDEEQVHVREKRDRAVERGRGIEDQAGLHARVTNYADRLPNIMIALHVDREVVDPRVRERSNELLRVRDHEVPVEGDLRQGSDRRDDGGPHREIRHEVAVHHVYVEQVRTRLPCLLPLLPAAVQPRRAAR